MVMNYFDIPLDMGNVIKYVVFNYTLVITVGSYTTLEYIYIIFLPDESW